MILMLVIQSDEHLLILAQQIVTKWMYIYTNNNACDDGEACTTGDACNQGSCVGYAVDCSDNDPCTIDVCNGYMLIHSN